MPNHVRHFSSQHSDGSYYSIGDSNDAKDNEGSRLIKDWNGATVTDINVQNLDENKNGDVNKTVDQYTAAEETTNNLIPEALPLITKISLHNKAEGNLY